MVATVTQLTSATRTTEYFEQEGYYATGDPEHRKASRWHGRGAEALRLRRHVAPARLTDVLAGRVPRTEIVLGRLRDGEHEHRPGVDITLQAPKSVSLAALVAGDGRIVTAHDAAVRETLDFIEDHLLVTRSWDRAKRRHDRVSAPSMVAATFRHKANRNLEPHLHTHAVIANMTGRPGGRWSSLDMGMLGPAAKLIGAHYRNALASRLRALGYALRPSMVGQVPGFEIAGYDRPLLEQASSRRGEIMEWIRSRGLANTAANRQKAAYATRRRKDEPHHRELEARWRGQAWEMGIERNPPRRAAGRRREERDAENRKSLLEIVTLSVEHLAERSSVFREADLCMLSLAHTPGVYSHAEYVAARDQLKRDGHLVDAVRRGLGPCLVTARALRAEREIISLMKRSLGRGRPLAAPERVSAMLADASLTAGQRQAVSTILLGGGVTVGIQGYAGTGKTAMLRAVKELAAGRKVIALAPSGAAVRGLRAEAGLAARTLQGFLARHRDVADGVAEEETLTRLQQEFAGAVVILDEASMTGTTQMQELMRISERLGFARLVLVGDTRQLRAVEAGQPFRQLQGAGMPTAMMDEVLRQRTPHLREAVARIIEGKPMQAIGRLGGQVHEVEFGELGRTAAELWLGLDDAARDATVILAPTHEIRAEINETVREGLAADQVLGGPELELDRLIGRGMTRARKGDIRNWSEGDAVVFHHDLWGGKARAGECFTVNATCGEHAVLAHDDGRRLRVRPGGKRLRYQLEVYETAPIRIRAGDRIRWTRNDPGRGLVNGERARILGIGPKIVRLEANGREVRMARDDVQLRHIDHAYSSTVHGAQGITADRVIAVLDSGHGALTDQATFYVEVSRARDEVVILTDNRQQLAETLEERSGMRMTALEAVGEKEAAALALPGKHPVLTADSACATLRMEAEEAGRVIHDMPGFRDVAGRLERERGLEWISRGYRDRIENHLAWISREAARRSAVASFGVRCRRAIDALGPPPAAGPSVREAGDLAREGRAMVEMPEYAPHLRLPGLRSRVWTDLIGLRSALAGNAAQAVMKDWRDLRSRARHDGTLPCYTDGHDALMARIETLAANPSVPGEFAGTLRRITDENRVAQDRRQQLREFAEQLARNSRWRRTLFLDGAADRGLPQLRPGYAAWRRQAEELRERGGRMSREGAVWAPHLEFVRWGIETLRAWLARMADMFRRDDRVLAWAEQEPLPDHGGLVADPRQDVRAAGDLVLGDLISWLERDGGDAVVRDGRIVGVRPGDAGETYDIDVGSGSETVSARDLFRGDVHRRRWPVETTREALRADARPEYPIACEIGSGIVPGDAVRWIDLVPGQGPDGDADVCEVFAKVVSVTPGAGPGDDRIRLGIIDGGGGEALPAGTVIEIGPERLCRAGRFHRAPWDSETGRDGALAELARQREARRDHSPGFEM